LNLFDLLQTLYLREPSFSPEVGSFILWFFDLKNPNPIIVLYYVFTLGNIEQTFLLFAKIIL